MRTTPPDGTPALIAGQMHRDDGQDRALRATRRRANLALALCVLSLLLAVAAHVLARFERRPAPPALHLPACPASPPCPAVPPCAACPACPSRTEHRR